jgi:hypothetical protein
MSAQPTPDLFTPVAAEDWLAQRLSELGHPIEPTAGATLKDRIRAAISAAGIGMVVAGRHPSGKGVETLEGAFERIYGQPLEPKPIRKTRSTRRKVTA